MIAVSELYRYVSHPDELQQLRRLRLIRSVNPALSGATWLTPDRYNDPAEAQRRLALSRLPTHRIGPIPRYKVPVFDIEPRTVAALNGQPGLGSECRTQLAIWVFGIWNYDTDDWSEF